MRRRLRLVMLSVGLIVLVLVGVAVAGLAFRAYQSRQAIAALPSPPPFQLAACEDLKRPKTDNHWLIAGAGPCAEIADRTAPEFDVSAAEQANAWGNWIDTQSGAEVAWRSADGLWFEVFDRTPVLGFVDRISIRVEPLTANRSTVVIYSRSLTGKWDLGKNKSRVMAWLIGVGGLVDGN